MADVYWDDWCLVRFLEGVCWRYVAYQVMIQPMTERATGLIDLKDPDSHPDSRTLSEDCPVKVPTTKEAAEKAEKAFEDVIEHGKKITLDDHLVYHARK